jgi:phosphoribosylglycinamide formyltransferase 1
LKSIIQILRLVNLHAFNDFQLLCERKSIHMAIRIAIFASGNGSNFQRIAGYFAGNDAVEIAVLYCNRPDAFALERAATLGIPSVVFNRNQFYSTADILNDLHARRIDWIVLAGFLWLVPENILRAYKDRIVNIHPALLPKYGGKGMYGMRVHEAVVTAGDKESGISIHFVNEHYDEGQIVYQARCLVLPSDTAEDVAQKIHLLEYEHFPRVIEELLTKK